MAAGAPDLSKYTEIERVRRSSIAAGEVGAEEDEMRRRDQSAGVAAGGDLVASRAAREVLSSSGMMMTRGGIVRAADLTTGSAKGPMVKRMPTKGTRR